MTNRDDYQVLFLLGAMRSGTTFFRNALSSTPSVLTLGSELNQFWTDVGKAPCGMVENCCKRGAEDATPSISADVTDYFSNCYRSRNGLKNLAYRSYRKFRFGNESIFKANTPLYLLNKSTHLLNKVDFINAIFPAARFIYLVRDIRSQINSLRNHFQGKQNHTVSYPRNDGECWSFNTGSPQGDIDFYDYPYYWIEQNTIAMKSLDHLDGNRVLYLNFEEITTNLNYALEKCSKFLGIEYTAEDINTSLLNNTTAAPLDSWRREITESELEIIDQVISEHQADYDFIQSHFDDAP